MKAISLHQPWAQLCVTATTSHIIPDGVHAQRDYGRACDGPMVKWIETRSWPCPPAVIGQPLAIHATAKRPRDVWCSFMKDPEFPPELDPFHGTGRFSDPQESGDGEWWRYRWMGPLGAVVGSCRITASLPIVHWIGADHEQAWAHYEPTPTEDYPHGIVLVRGPSAAAECHRDGEFGNLTDQLPYGDYRPGRYAWIIDDAAPTTERCPWCWGRGWVHEPMPYSQRRQGRCCAESPIFKFDVGPVVCDEPFGHDGKHDGLDADEIGPHYQRYWTDADHGARPSPWCPVCEGAGRCNPVPAKGRQRIWEWAP